MFKIRVVWGNFQAFKYVFNEFAIPNLMIIRIGMSEIMSTKILNWDFGTKKPLNCIARYISYNQREEKIY